jgi:diguanylate cyclase (GGDEF)-like protein
LAGFKQPQSIYDISLPLLAYVIVPAIMIPMVTMGFVLLMSQENNRNLDYLSRHDSLTNCLNKKAFIEVFEKQIHHCNRYHNNLSLVMMDLDDFKRINDTLGHLVGDQVLMDFSQKVRSLLRDADYFGRFGGDEFFVLLPYTNQEQAELVVQRINHEGAKSNIAWSVSMGISEWHIGDSLDSLLSRSDQLLYENKDHKQNKE